MLEAQAGDAAPTYSVFDTSGTLTAAVSDDGEAKAEPARDPFGALLPGEVIQKPSGQLDDPTLAFAGAFGRETLPGSDLVKMGARVYDPGAGAFISRDPVTGGAAEPARRVAYAYAFNGPARYSDLDGRSVDSIVCDLSSICAPATVAHEYFDLEAKDPHSSGLSRVAAKVGRLLVSPFTCQNLATTVATVVAVVAGGRVGGRTAPGSAVGRKAVPAVPAGMSQSFFGKYVMRWGTGDAAARARIANLSREELESVGVTRKMALEWRDFYRNETLRNPKNPSAAGRADLMDAAARLLK